MKPNQPFFLLLFLFSKTVTGQVRDFNEYFAEIRKADTLYQQKQYLKSAQTYSYAFQYIDGFSIGNKYSAARAWAMAGLIDSAFANLRTEVSLDGFSDFLKLNKEDAFKKLHAYKEWKEIKRLARFSQKKEYKRLGKFRLVKKRLEAILSLDQKYRIEYDSILVIYGLQSKQVKNVLKKIGKIDKKNQRYVTKLIDKHGWLGYDIIGNNASTSLFIVIQHSDLPIQQKYLPLMRDAVKDKKARPDDLAMLEDRVLVREGKQQIYGTQVKYDSLENKYGFFPIADEINVDKRRAAIGLMPLAEYAKHWNIIYKKPE